MQITSLKMPSTDNPAELVISGNFFSFFFFKLDIQLICRHQYFREVNLHNLEVVTASPSKAIWTKLLLNLLRKKTFMKLIEMPGLEHTSQEDSALFFTLYQQMLVGGWKLLSSHCRESVPCLFVTLVPFQLSGFMHVQIIPVSCFQCLSYLEFILLPRKQITQKKEC